MTKSYVLLVAVAFCAGATGYGAGYFSRTAPSTVAAVPPPERTVSWFIDHRPELAQKIATCKDNPGGALTDPECANAAEADGKIGLAEFRAGLGHK
jgi:hypothetical protein